MRGSTKRISEWTADSSVLAADIATAVAEAVGVDPLELPPLQDTLDVDRLAEYIEYDQDGQDITVPYAGYGVTLTATGAVTAVPLSVVSPAAIAATLAASTTDDPARGWQWEPAGGAHSARYDRGEGERTLIYGGQGRWIEADETLPVEP